MTVFASVKRLAASVVLPILALAGCRPVLPPVPPSPVPPSAIADCQRELWALMPLEGDASAIAAMQRVLERLQEDGSPAAVDVLEEFLLNDASPPAMKRRAIIALARIGTPEAGTAYGAFQWALDRRNQKAGRLLATVDPGGVTVLDMMADPAAKLSNLRPIRTAGKSIANTGEQYLIFRFASATSSPRCWLVSSADGLTWTRPAALGIVSDPFELAEEIAAGRPGAPRPSGADQGEYAIDSADEQLWLRRVTTAPATQAATQASGQAATQVATQTGAWPARPPSSYLPALAWDQAQCLPIEYTIAGDTAAIRQAAFTYVFGTREPTTEPLYLIDPWDREIPSFAQNYRGHAGPLFIGGGLRPNSLHCDAIDVFQLNRRTGRAMVYVSRRSTRSSDDRRLILELRRIGARWLVIGEEQVEFNQSRLHTETPPPAPPPPPPVARPATTAAAADGPALDRCHRELLALASSRAADRLEIGERLIDELRAMGSPEAVDILGEFLVMANSDPRLRQSAIIALGRIGSVEAAAAVLDFESSSARSRIAWKRWTDPKAGWSGPPVRLGLPKRIAVGGRAISDDGKRHYMIFRDLDSNFHRAESWVSVSPDGKDDWSEPLPVGLADDPMAMVEAIAAGRQAMPDQPADTDGDGVADITELRLGLDPRRPDTDGDGLGDGLEISLGLDPQRADTDLDGWADGVDPFPLVPRGRRGWDESSDIRQAAFLYYFGCRQGGEPLYLIDPAATMFEGRAPSLPTEYDGWDGPIFVGGPLRPEALHCTAVEIIRARGSHDIAHVRITEVSTHDGFYRRQVTLRVERVDRKWIVTDERETP